MLLQLKMIKFMEKMKIKEVIEWVLIPVIIPLACLCVFGILAVVCLESDDMVTT